MEYRSWQFGDWNNRIFDNYFIKRDDNIDPVRHFVVTNRKIGEIAGAENEIDARDHFFGQCKSQLKRFIPESNRTRTDSIPQAMYRLKMGWKIDSHRIPPFFGFLYLICCAAALYDEKNDDPNSIHRNLREILGLGEITYDQASFSDPDYHPSRRWLEVEEWCKRHPNRYRPIQVPSIGELDDRRATLIGHGPTMAIPRGQDMVHLTQLVNSQHGLGVEPSLDEALATSRLVGGIYGLSGKVIREARAFRNCPTQDSAFWQILTEAAIHGVVRAPEARPLWLVASRDFPTGFLVEFVGPDEAPSKGFIKMQGEEERTFDLDLSAMRLPLRWMPWGWGSECASPLDGGGAFRALREVNPRLHQLIEQGVLLFERHFEFQVLTDAKERGDLAFALVRKDLLGAFIEWAGGRASESQWEGWSFVERFDPQAPLPSESPLRQIRCLGTAVPRTKRGWIRGGLVLRNSGEDGEILYLGNGHRMPELVLQVPSMVRWLDSEAVWQPGVHPLPQLEGREGSWDGELTVTALGEAGPFLDRRRLYFDTEPSCIDLAEFDTTRFTGSTAHGQRPYGNGAGFPAREVEGEPDELDELFRPVIYLGRNPGQWVDNEAEATWRLVWDDDLRAWRGRFLPLGRGCGQDPCNCREEVLTVAWEAGRPLQFGGEKQKSRWRTMLGRAVRMGQHPCTQRLFHFHRRDLLQGRNPRATPPFAPCEPSSLLPARSLREGWQAVLWDGEDLRTVQLRKLTSTLLAMSRTKAFIAYDEWSEAARFAGVDEGRLGDLQRSLEEAGFLDMVRMMPRPFLWGCRILPPSLACFQESGTHYWVSYGAWLPGQHERFLRAFCQATGALEGAEIGVHARVSRDPWIPPGFRIRVPDPDPVQMQALRESAKSNGIALTFLDKEGLLDWRRPDGPPCWDDPGTPPPNSSGMRPMGASPDGLRAFRWLDGQAIKFFGSDDGRDWSYDLLRTRGLMAHRQGIECFKAMGDLDILVGLGYRLPLPLARAAALLGPCLPFPAPEGAGTLYRFPTEALRDSALIAARVSLSAQGD